MTALQNHFAARGAPCFGSPFDARDVREATLAEKLRGPQGAKTALADHKNWAIVGNLVEPGGEIGLRQIDGARNVSTGKLFGLADVKDGGIRRPCWRTSCASRAT